MSTDLVKKHEERGHHPMSPSNYPKWKLCPKFKNTGGTSEAAAIGTLKHTIFERELLKRNEFIMKYHKDNEKNELLPT